MIAICRRSTCNRTVNESGQRCGGFGNSEKQQSHGARRNHTATLKAKMALAALKETRRWPNWLSSSMCIPTRSWLWKNRLREGAARIFGEDKAGEQVRVDMTRMQAKIGELSMENDFCASREGWRIQREQQVPPGKQPEPRSLDGNVFEESRRWSSSTRSSLGRSRVNRP